MKVFIKSITSLAFILHFARLALSLDKIGCASEMKIKSRFPRFYFAFRSSCTIFAPLIENNNGNFRTLQHL